MRILLVDDEQPLLALLSQYLVRSGHQTAVAETFAAGLEFTTQPSGSFDAAVVDLSLPDGNGEDLARKILEAHPAARVVIATGYAYEPPNSLTGKVIVLQKPFLPRRLLHVLG